jgi:hypothetical protein
VSRDEGAALILLLETSYAEGPADLYLLPVGFAAGEHAAQIGSDAPKAIIARLTIDETPGALIDGTQDDLFRAHLFALIAGKRRYRGRFGELVGHHGSRFARVPDAAGGAKQHVDPVRQRVDSEALSPAR